MEIKNYITTIQWGKGLHYIVETYNDERQIEYSIKYHKKRTHNQTKGKKGAKATVRAWKRVDEDK